MTKSLQDNPLQGLEEVVRVSFKEYLETSIQGYIETMSTLFAYTVFTESETSLNDEPLNLSKYKTLSDLLPTRELMDFTGEAENALKTMTWEKYFISMIDNYVKDTFSEMLSQGKNKLIKSLIPRRVIRDEEALFLVIRNAEKLVGEEFFESCSKDLQAILFSASPSKVFEKGKVKAQSIITEADDLAQKAEKDFLDLAKLLEKYNNLWNMIRELYKKTYKEEMPLGRITDELYEKKLKVVLEKLYLRNVSVTDIQGLALYGSKFTSEVAKKVTVFKYK